MRFLHLFFRRFRGEVALENLRVHGLVLQQVGGHRLQLGFALDQDGAAAVVGRVDDGADLRVHLGGGLLGNYLFNYALSVSSTPNTVRGIQSAILAVFLVCVIIFVSGNFKTFNVKNPIAILLSGLLLGTAAAFLGIGGGPINVAFLTLMFSFTMRDAAVYSVAVIFFSQCANIISTYIKTGFSGFDMKVLLVIIPVAVIGGFIGSILNRKCNEKAIKVTFTIAVSLVAALSLYNAVMSFI